MLIFLIKRDTLKARTAIILFCAFGDFMGPQAKSNGEFNVKSSK